MWSKEKIINAFKEKNLVDENELKEWLKDKEKVTVEELSEFLRKNNFEWIGDEYTLYGWMKDFVITNYGLKNFLWQYFDCEKFRVDLVKRGKLIVITIPSIITTNKKDYYCETKFYIYNPHGVMRYE